MASELTAVLKAALDKDTRRGGPGECWPWCGPLNGGVPRLRPRVGGRALNLSARKAAYEQARGPVPAGRVVGDTCGNPACLNPAHLVVTSSVAVALSRRPAAPAPAPAPAGPAPTGPGFAALADGLARLTRADVPALDAEIAALDARAYALRALRAYLQARPAPAARAEVRAPAPAPKKATPKKPAPKASRPRPRTPTLARRLAYFLAASGPTSVADLAAAMGATTSGVEFQARAEWFTRDRDTIDVTDAGRAVALEGRP